MKYIIFVSKAGTPECSPFPIMLAGHLSHLDVAKIFAPAGFEPISAGFVKFDDGFVTTHDESMSLGLCPHARDSALIQAHYRAHLQSIGIKP